MQEDSSKNKSSDITGKLKNHVMIKFIAEELIIALLLALIFYMI